MAYLTTADLKETYLATLPTINRETSCLSRAGASNVSYETTGVRSMSLGGAAVVGEGEEKPLSNLAISEEDLLTLKLVHMMVVTDEFEDTKEGRALAAEYINEAARSISVSSDIAILNGTNPATGLAVAAYSASNLKDNATAVTVDGTTVVTNEDALIGALSAAADPEFGLLSKAGFSAVAYASTTNGSKYPNASRNETFSFWTTDVARCEAVGLDGWDEASQTTNNVLGYFGNFSRIVRAFTDVQVRVKDAGTVGTHNLTTENKTLYIVEQTMKFYVEDPSNFAVALSA